jgi:hypothetical protein
MARTHVAAAPLRELMRALTLPRRRGRSVNPSPSTWACSPHSGNCYRPIM